jgi:predicted house-cleaning noncanonical NTP pyrophosphatase (MazG superfamily)
MTRMRFAVEKLIRDRLPQIMRDQGLAVFERHLTGDDLALALRDKLMEEAREAVSATEAELLDELADVSEVVRALAATIGRTAEDVELARQAKHAARGGFELGVWNAAVEAEAGLPAADYYLARPDQYPRRDS